MADMQSTGWKVSPDNLDALSKNDANCLFVSDHMIVWRNFWASENLNTSNVSLSNRIKSTIALLNTLKDTYEAKD